jgi:DNA-binding Lrp family transcriptional regulator
MSKAGSSALMISTDRLPGEPRPAVTLGTRVRTRSRVGGGASLDFALLRECSCEESDRLGFDPRKSPEVMARRLGVSPWTVRRRLRDWKRRGFLLGYDVIPHPALLGGRLAVRILEFSDPIAQERAMGALGWIDGVIQIVPARSSLLVVYFVDARSRADRRLPQFQRIEGARDIGPEMPFPLPPCPRRMSSSDWRLVRALRRRPEARVAELAREVGHSTRSTSRRYSSLLDDGALMFDPIMEFSRFSQSLAVLVAYIEHPEMREEIELAIRAMHPQSIRSEGSTPTDSNGAPATVQMWVAAPTSAELDELPGRVSHIPGVSQPILWYARSIVPVRTWLDERIELMLSVTTPGSSAAQ